MYLKLMLDLLKIILILFFLKVLFYYKDFLIKNSKYKRIKIFI